jgi:hypothetical protein
MGIQVWWDDQEETTLRWDFEGIWHWHDVQRAEKQSDQLLSHVNYPVSIIVNASCHDCVPLSSSVLSRFKDMVSSGELHNLGSVVVVANPAYIAAIRSALGRIYHKWSNYVTFTESMDEARQLARHGHYTHH